MREYWTPAQTEHVAKLRGPSELGRPFWLLIVSPTAPPECPHRFVDGLLLHRDHHGWRVRMTPCEEVPGCCCTVWALTVQEAAEHNKRNPIV